MKPLAIKRSAAANANFPARTAALIFNSRARRRARGKEARRHFQIELNFLPAELEVGTLALAALFGFMI